MIHIASKRRKPANILKDFPNAEIIDVTSKGPKPFQKFSPFYPHGNIPIPFSPGAVSQSVEGIWQGLKVFEEVGIDPTKFDNSAMKGLKRTVRKFGKPKGHQKGTGSTELFDYLTARQLIFLPSYRWVLESCLHEEVKLLTEIAAKKPLFYWITRRMGK